MSWRGPGGRSSPCAAWGNAYHARRPLSHEYADLTDGIVFDGVIECPLHNGRFDVVSGDAVRSPACGSLQTYPVEVRGDGIFLRVRT